MVDPSWTRVGLGIVQNSNQVYYLTQEFSSRDMALYPLTNSELADIQKSIINYIQSQFPHLKTENKQLSSDLSSFQKSKSNKNVVEYLNGLGYNKFDIDEVEISYNAGNYIELLEGNDYFQPNEQYRRVGVSVMYKDGNLLI
jgi:C4-dicarboxylate-specific signal transduction histidine kinase